MKTQNQGSHVNESKKKPHWMLTREGYLESAHGSNQLALATEHSNQCGYKENHCHQITSSNDDKFGFNDRSNSSFVEVLQLCYFVDFLQ